MRNLKKILLLCLLFVCSGCATLRNPVPQELVAKATIKNMAEIRTIMASPSFQFKESLLESFKQEDPKDFPAGPHGEKVYPVLILSGGGANGAYGAGLLKGWSEEGSRPVFKAVTGVSTGAIIAPFAFLGKKFDAQLEEYYTTTSTKDVLVSKGIFSILFGGNSLKSTKPLADNLKRVLDEKIIERVAAEHRRGRRLFVGTVNLDAQRFFVWNMGTIACSGDAELFRKVILASASIPVEFPPVYFHVEADGKQYDEMHVDGGTMAQAFSAYKLLEHMEGAAKKMGLNTSKMQSKLYIIRNGYVTPNYKQVKDKLSSIAGRSIDTIIGAQGVGDIYRMYVFAHDRGNDYNLAYIPADFRPKAKELFDPEEMKRLFDRGYEDALKGYPWRKFPPDGLEASEAESDK